jgi:membrane associated rhomboid family serine protease
MQNQSFSDTARRGFNSLPAAIRVIISINVVIFLIQLVSYAIGSTALNSFFTGWLAYTSNVLHTVTHPWTLVTYTFLHADFWHILVNMLMLWWLGSPVEERLGPRTFCAIYFGAGIGGALINLFFATLFGWTTSVIGASGAVFGIMVALTMLYPRMPIYLFFMIRVELRYAVAGFVLLNLLWVGSNDGTAYIVHLGGAASGYLLMKAWRKGLDLSHPIYTIERWWYKLKGGHKKQTASNSNMYSVSDVEVVEEDRQSELDDILEKISEDGYDALTKAEKKKLFELSKNK